MGVNSLKAAKGKLPGAFALSLLACVLFVVIGSPVSAQQKRTSTPGGVVKRLLEATETRKHTAATFEELVTRYEEHWPEGVIAGYKARGLFKPLSAEQTAQMEKLIREFSKNLFKGIKSRVVQEIITVDNLHTISEGAFSANLTEREIDELAAFCETSAGKKYVRLYWEVATRSLVSGLEAKGMFAPSPSPEEEEGKIDRIAREFAHTPPIKFEEVLAALKVALVKDLTAGELKELVAFSETPLGGKLAAASQKLAAEIIANNIKLLAPRVGAIAREVFEEQMEVFAVGVKDVFNSGKPARGSKTSGN